VEALLLGCAGLLAYAYAGYPLLAALLAVVARRPHERGPIEPPVSLLILAYNEEQAIEAKLQNALALDYPADKLEIVVVSDGSTDRTDELVQGYADRGVRLYRADDHPGKSGATNRAAPTTSGEILIFSDATGDYDPGVVRAFVRNFADPDVGAATGRVTYSYGESATAAGFKAYQRWVVFARQAESEWGTETSVSGSICAVRRELFRAIPQDLDFDFCHPLHVAQAGLRTVYEADATSLEEARERPESEFAARVRMAVLAYSFVPYLLRGLVSVRRPSYVFQVFSHKLLRWAAPFLLTLLLLLSLVLAPSSAFAQLLLALQLILYGSAGLGYQLRGRGGLLGRVLGIPLFFVTIHLAFAVGFWRWLNGERIGAWTPERGG
jgi:cellulose synthase/poly-beta-1,6-N-acetylglucosamine synthase-like glycosyltransferase